MKFVRATDVSLQIYSAPLSLSIFDPDEHARKFTIKVMLKDFDGADVDYVEMGEAFVTQINLDNVAECGDCVFNVFDAASQELTDLYFAVFDKDGVWFKPQIDDLTDGHNLLYIDCILLKKEYRGQKLGGIIAKAIAELMGSGCAVLLKPCPINSILGKTGNKADQEMEKYELPPITRKSVPKIVKKLRQVYRMAGFVPIGKTDFMMLPTVCRLKTATAMARDRDNYNRYQCYYRCT